MLTRCRLDVDRTGAKIMEGDSIEIRWRLDGDWMEIRWRQDRDSMETR